PPSMTCSPTMTIGFINQSSSNVVSWSWLAPYYVNGPSTNTSNLPNPTFTVTQGSLNPYTIYPLSGIYVSLIVTTANGCKDTIFHIYDSIQRPTARYNRSVKEGCAPLTVTLRDTSTTFALYPIQSYTWISGITPASASTSLTGTVPPAIINPTFTYVNPGVYTPTLMIMTATGCYDIFVDTVTVANPPNITFSVSPLTACWNTPVTVTMSTTPPTTPAVQHWHVDSDDGFFSGCVTQNIQQWNFTHVGVHTFSVSGYLHSCKGTGTSTVAVTINGPIGRTRYETNCTNRKDVSFFSHLQDAQGAVLNFGDNSSVGITGTPGGIATHSIVHTYSASGNYTASLTSTNSITGCSPNTFTFVVKVRDAVANFTLPAVGCSSTTITFDGSPSQDVLIACQRGYVWYVDNQPPDDNPSPILTHTFATTGTHTVMLMVKDENSCADTTKKTFRISAATPQFTFSQNPICSGGTVALINNTPGTPDPINTWQWVFGDGSPNSSVQSPTHTYTGASPSQTYIVSLTATNIQGCVDTQTQVITINNPIAFINPNPSTPCAGSPIMFTGPSGVGNTYTFSFGAGSTTTLSTTSNTASYTYTNAGNYTASITLQDAAGCKNSAQTAVTVHSMTAADFTLSSASSTSTNNICSGAPVSYTALTQSTYPLNYQWSIATLNSSVVTNFIPASTSGTVAVTLTVSTSPLGCSAVAVKTFTVSKKPSANLNLDKNPICFGNALNINLKDSNSVAYWTYFFGDGTDITQNAGTSTQTVSHTYTTFPTSGNYPITVIYFSSGGACKDQATINVNLIKIAADFNRNNEIAVIDYNHCIGTTDVFSNTTAGSSGYTFSWNFGDGSTGSGQTSNHTYTAAGVYQVTLNVVDPVNNCLGDAVKTMTINPLPNVNIVSLDSICLNAPFVLNSNTSPNVVTYTWSPASNVTSPNSSSTTATSSVTPFTYSLGVTDSNGCSNDTSKSIYVQMPPISANWDTTVIIGQNIPMNGYAGTNFSYTWTPVTDLTCTNCIFPTSTSTVDITYTLVIEDGLGCFKTTSTYSIHVDPKATVDVPTAFTPNGDGTNDIIYVDGWGIKKLNYFRIFNRWGQLLFESNDIKVGWNGTFNGVPQNMETYIYQASVETYVDKEPILKTGSFKLIR
ncbi:MAG: large protein, partial [Bacteroidetes bacterium]|nr:large protein [Bacteroidota bacterium]